MYDSVGIVTYKNHNGETLTEIDFDDMSVAELNGSFKKAFKQVREFDRQQISVVKNANTSINRASFGLANVN